MRMPRARTARRARGRDRSRVRVVHVSSAHPADDPRIYEKMCTSLAAAGYDVRLVATGEVPVGAPVPVVALPRSGRRLVRMTLGVARAVLTAARMRPHVVHLHDPELIPAGLLLRLLGTRVVFDSHEHIAASVTNKSYLPRPVRGAVQRATAALVSLVDRAASGVVCATPAIAADFANERTAVVQNFPILDQWDDADGAERPPGRLVFIGGLSEGRGAWQMMDLVERLGSTHGVTLHIAGAMPDDLLAGLREHPGWAHTEFLGMLEREPLAELLAGASVGVVLFLPEPNHVHSQPTKMFEYMAAGLPVLASDYPLWRELVESAGVGVVADPLDADAVLAAATRLVEDPAEARGMGRRGRELVESTRNWRVESERLVAFYDELTGARSAT